MRAEGRLRRARSRHDRRSGRRRGHPRRRPGPRGRVAVGHAGGLRPRRRHRRPSTLQQVVRDGVGGVDGLDLVQALMVSPGGRFVYAAGLADDAIAIFDRDTETGDLAYLGQVKNGVAGFTGLDGVRGLAMTPDGLFLFATSYNDDAVAIFRRDGFERTPLRAAGGAQRHRRLRRSRRRARHRGRRRTARNLYAARRARRRRRGARAGRSGELRRRRRARTSWIRWTSRSAGRSPTPSSEPSTRRRPGS